MGLAHTVKTAIRKARSSVGDLAVTIQVKKKTGSSYVNGVNTPTYSSIDVDGAYDEFKAHEIDGSVVQTTDVRIMLFIDSAAQIPVTQDIAVVGSETYQVLRTFPVYAGNEVVACMIHLRK